MPVTIMMHRYINVSLQPYHGPGLHVPLSEQTACKIDGNLSLNVAAKFDANIFLRIYMILIFTYILYVPKVLMLIIKYILKF